MTKITLTNLVNLENQTTAVNAINANNAVLIPALDNTLSRDGTFPNQMGATLDMNSHPIINLPTPVSNYEPIRLIDVNTINGSGITVSPLPVGGTNGQVLTKNSSTNFDTSWVTPTILTVTPEQFGYTTYGTGDAGPAIQAAINSVSVGTGVRVEFGAHIYQIVTPILISKPYVSLNGQGQGTVLQYTPTINGTTMITWHDASVTTGVYFGGLTNFQIISGDSAHTKTAINLIDIGDMEIAYLYVPLWTDVTGNSIALKTNGRQTTSFHDLRIFADIPIFLDANPNSHLATDHFHFWNLYLIPNPARSCVTIGNIWVTNTTFDGFQAWVGGTHGLNYTAPSPGALHAFGLSFYNVRVEEPTDPAGYNFLVDTPSGLTGLLLKNCKLDEGRNGVYARGVETLSLEECYYPVVSPASKVAFDVDTTCKSVLISNCRWESGCTQNLNGMSTSYAYTTPTVSPIATNALYYS